MYTCAFTITPHTSFSHHIRLNITHTITHCHSLVNQTKSVVIPYKIHLVQETNTATLEADKDEHTNTHTRLLLAAGFPPLPHTEGDTVKRLIADTLKSGQPPGELDRMVCPDC